MQLSCAPLDQALATLAKPLRSSASSAFKGQGLEPRSQGKNDLFSSNDLFLGTSAARRVCGGLERGGG